MRSAASIHRALGHGEASRAPAAAYLLLYVARMAVIIYWCACRLCDRLGFQKSLTRVKCQECQKCQFCLRFSFDATVVLTYSGRGFRGLGEARMDITSIQLVTCMMRLQNAVVVTLKTRLTRMSSGKYMKCVVKMTRNTLN
jgi:hypothetical protein